MTQLSDFPPDVQALAQRGWDRWFVNAEGDLRVIVASLIMEDRAGRVSAVGLTAMQAKCLRAIQTHQAAQGVSPTVRDLMAELGLASTSGVIRLLEGLEDRGVIRRLQGRARAITIIANPSTGA